MDSWALKSKYPLVSTCPQGGKEESKDLGVDHPPSSHKHDCWSFPARGQPATLPQPWNFPPATEWGGGACLVRTMLWVLLLFKMFALKTKSLGRLQTQNPNMAALV